MLRGASGRKSPHARTQLTLWDLPYGGMRLGDYYSAGEIRAWFYSHAGYVYADSRILQTDSSIQHMKSYKIVRIVENSRVFCNLNNAPWWALAKLLF